MHLAIDADTGRIVAASLTAKEVDDGAEVGALLDQITGEVASFTADGGYDQDNVYADVAERYPNANVVPPRTTAAPSETAESAPTQRDHHLQYILPSMGAWGGRSVQATTPALGPRQRLGAESR